MRILYFHIIRHVLLIGAYSLISAYCFVDLNTNIRYILRISAYMKLDLALHRYLSARMLVQRSSILELIKIAMITFNFHALQAVCAFSSWVTGSIMNDHTIKHLVTPLY